MKTEYTYDETEYALAIWEWITKHKSHLYDTLGYLEMRQKAIEIAPRVKAEWEASGKPYGIVMDFDWLPEFMETRIYWDRFYPSRENLEVVKPLSSVLPALAVAGL